MKLNYKSFLTAATLMVVGANANAGLVWDIYAGGNVGVGSMALFTDDNFRDRSAQSYGVLAGIDLPVVRFEGEYNWLDSKNLDMQIAMANAYVKFGSPIIINPYIGVGVGMMLDAESTMHIDIDPSIVYQAMLGLTFNLPVIPFKIDVEGRALYIPELYSVGGIDFGATQYEGRVKLRLVF